MNRLKMLMLLAVLAVPASVHAIAVQGGDGATIDVGYQLGGSSVPVKVVGLPTLTKGTQGSTGLTTQDLKDAGRAVYIASATGVTPITSEAVATLSASSGLGAGDFASASSLSVPSGKTLRLQAATFTWRATAAGQGNSGVLRIRAMSTGATTVTSPMVFQIGISSNSAAGVISGNAITYTENFPEGVELSGNNTFGVSHIEGSTQGAVDIAILGYVY